MPLFSIIVVHYQGAVSHELLCRGIASLEAQTYRDFEIRCYHDGPLLQPEVPWPVPVVCSPVRHNDWGHSLRDRGMREATGDYIVHFNADNILYPFALETLAAEIRREPRISIVPGETLDTNDIIIFPIIMHGLIRFRDYTWQFKPPRQNFYLILNGIPPVVQNIDCMQLVMKRELWLREGGWRDKRQLGDGYMYEAFAAKYGHRHVGPVLGEHF